MISYHYADADQAKRLAMSGVISPDVTIQNDNVMFLTVHADFNPDVDDLYPHLTDQVTSRSVIPVDLRFRFLIDVYTASTSWREYLRAFVADERAVWDLRNKWRQCFNARLEGCIIKRTAVRWYALERFKDHEWHPCGLHNPRKVSDATQ